MELGSRAKPCFQDVRKKINKKYHPEFELSTSLLLGHLAF